MKFSEAQRLYPQAFASFGFTMGELRNASMRLSEATEKAMKSYVKFLKKWTKIV